VYRQEAVTASAPASREWKVTGGQLAVCTALFANITG